MALTLVIGNKNYSSWSLRPWLAMQAAGIPFEEKLIPLYQEEYRRELRALSPSGKVPLLIDGDIQVWESLAILDHLAERFPAAGLWPGDLAARAYARAICAEMHAGFMGLRRACPMNLWRPVKARPLSPEAQADVARIEAIWRECRQRFGAGGPFLFGRFSAADAMYAPVASASRPMRCRFRPPQEPTATPCWRSPRSGNGRRPGSRSPGCCPRTSPTGRRCSRPDGVRHGNASVHRPRALAARLPSFGHDR